MALKSVLETLDGIDDAVKPFYAEADGVYVLSVDGIDAHPQVANLKNAYERVKSDKTTLAQERDALKGKLSSIPEDFDPEKWAKFKDGKPDEAALVKVRKDLEAERDQWKTKAEEAESRIMRVTLDRDLTDALTAAGVTDATLAKGARALLSGSVKVSDDGKAFVETDMGPVPLQDHVKRWAGGEGKAFVTAPKGGGGKGGDRAGTGKTVTRSEFDAMSQSARAEFSKQGGKVVDA